jgi:hypothetical protein
MAREVRQRIVRPVTAEEQERHAEIRKQIDQEFPEIQQWARGAAARHRERVAVGTVLVAEESNVLDAIDAYAAKHSLASRSAVVREALANLLGIDIARR